MKLLGDYHTHTTASDGKNTIEDNVLSALNKGLKQVAITDHSFMHMSSGITKKEFALQIKIISELKEKYPQIEILHGLESNLMGLNGEIDIDAKERDKYEVLIVGYHYTYKPLSFKNFFNFWLPGALKINRKKNIERNTQAYINAIKNNKIDILAHLNYGIKVDCVKIAQVAKEHEVYVELNGKKIHFSDDEMLGMVKTGVKFIINSDAHISENVGKNNKAFALIERLNVPKNQVVNLTQLPKFKNYNTKEKY